MNTKNIALSSVLALAAFSGSAFAAGPMPTSGEGPLFLEKPAEISAVARSEVAVQATRQQPLAGNVQQETVMAKSPFSREQVRAETRKAISGGFHVASGENS